MMEYGPITRILVRETYNYSNLWINTNESINYTDDDNNGLVDDIYGWNFADGNNILISECDPMDSHGTLVSSIIAAKTNNDAGIWGVAGGYNSPGVKIMSLKCSHVTNPSFIETDFYPLAIDYAVTYGARVIVMPYESKSPIDCIEQTLYDYYDQGNGNIVFLAPTGNGNEQNYTAYPAKYDEVIAVGATECDWFDTNSVETRWDWYEFGSNFGDEIEVTAPGGPFSANVGFENGIFFPTYSYKTSDEQYFFNCSTSRSVAFAAGVVALMLSANPCLTAEEVRLTLQNTADKVGGYNYDGTGWSNELGYGRINALAAIQPIIIEPITNTQTWNANKIIYNHIIVTSDGVLTINNNSTISFMNWASVIIEPGGQLIVENATLTGVCEKMWPGIQVWGNSGESQATLPGQPCAQGKLVLNNAIIENAVNAVELWKPDDYSTTGGIIYATDAVFRNNASSIHALYYRNLNPLDTSQEFDYYGVFTNCSFLIDDYYLGQETFNKHVDLCEVRGLTFYGCTFSVSHEAENISGWNLGIAAYNAGFKVLPYCLTPTVPCADYDSCRFNGFYWAIGSFNSCAIDYPVLVTHARFDDNGHGIYLSGTDYAICINNYIEAGYDSPFAGNCGFASGIGIDIQQSNGFVVENNEITKNDVALNGIYAGIRVQNCPSVHDIIYKNELIGLSYGNYAEGTNRLYPLVDATGVEYECNFNLSNAVDFIVVNYPNYPGMIRGSHGNRDTASGNYFSPYADLHLSNEGYQQIHWFYFENNTLEQPIYIHQNPPHIYIIPEAVENANECPNHYGGVNDIRLDTSEMQQKETEFIQNLADYNAVNYMYESLIDGGNTEGELTDIQTAEAEDMWELRTHLLGLSPHLSQEVLRAVSDRTDVFPDEVLLEILSANPDELDKDTLLSYLEQKEDPLPEYMIEILSQVASGVTYKTILQEEIAGYHAGKTQAAQDIIRSILFDTVFDATDYRNWLDNLSSLASDKQIIASYLAEYDTASALYLLNLIPDLYELEGDELDDFLDYKSLMEIQMDWKMSGKSVYQLDSLDIVSLESYATDSGSTAGNIARNMLAYSQNQHFCNCLPLNDSSYYKSGHEIPVFSVDEMCAVILRVEPNPAKTWVAFNYELPGDQSKGVITISDATGKLLSRVEVSGTKGQTVIDTRSFKPGLYYYNLNVSGFNKAGKMIIQ